MADLGQIVALVERKLGAVTRTPEPLPGGITNHNFRVRFGERECVLRLVGEETELLGVDRVAEVRAGNAAAALGIGPAILDGGDGYLVTEFLDCRPVPAASLRRAPDSAARALRAFHDSGLQLSNRFWVPDLLDRYAGVVRARGASLPPEYLQTQSLVARIADVLPLLEPVPCHDDLLGANVLAAADRPDHLMLVDWEYAGMGHRMFDLGNLAVNNEFDAEAEERLLEAYFNAPPSQARRAGLALMRIMSDAREAAWGIVQEAISELEFDFGDYARRHFARLAGVAAGPQLEEWLDAATA